MKEYKYKINGQAFEVKIDDIEGTQAKVTVNGNVFDVEMDRPMNKPAKPVQRPVVHVNHAPVAAARPAAPVANPGDGTPVLSPLPGTVNAITVPVGAEVKRGDVVAVLEAMKMENDIKAECNGVVKTICVHQGDTVREGAVLLTIG